ncbi:hypothetical protein [Actinophytocola sp.]|uniref:hypothetical protein n=1 Tax=Actinophytocola sp. TaxID=1872138 RepID=UPI00389B08C7
MAAIDLATRAVELTATYLATATARIPGSPAEQLYSLVAGHMRQTSAGSEVLAELENAPNNRGKKYVAAAKLAELVDQDPRFAAALERAVAGSPARANQYIAHNEVDGDVSGQVVQAASINGSVDQSRRTDNSRRTRINFGGLVLIIALVLGLGATVLVVVTNLLDSDTTNGSPHPGSDTDTNLGGAAAPPGENTQPTDNGIPPAGDCGRAQSPQLTLTPNRGSADTEITVSGVGFIANGRVSITFHADQMGEATTDCHGAFAATLPIPQKEFYRHFPDQTFDVHATELSAGGQYEGNGDFNGAQFYLTG